MQRILVISPSTNSMFLLQIAAGGETIDPRKSLPKAMRGAYIRIILSV
jgi:amino acid permease